jgi:hypothetical protein
MKILLYGVLIWLAVEALFSLYYHVWPNVAVDVGIALIFSYTLLKAAAILKTQN